MLKRTFIIFLFFFLLLNLSGMSQGYSQPLPKITIQGRAADLNTKMPIAEAEVVLLDLSRRPAASSFTNSAGGYQMSASIDAGYYLLTVSKNGYVSQEAKRLLRGGKTNIINFSLKLSSNLPPKIIRVQPENTASFYQGQR